MNALLVGGIAFVVAHVWLFGFGYAYYAFYLAVGAPESPTTILRWAIPAISFGFGVIGALALIPFRERVNYSSAIFVCLAAGAVLASAGMLAGAAAMMDHLKSEGFWGFICGLVLSVYACRQRKPITQQAHAGDARDARG